MAKNINKSVEFIETVIALRDYWLALPNKTTEEVVNGVLFSMMVMFDGDSGMNDFHALKIIDTDDRKRIDCGFIHELFCEKE